MYQLLRQREAVAARIFEITFLDPGVAGLRLQLWVIVTITALSQDVTCDRGRGGWYEHVARPSCEEIGHVESCRSA
jgi:hypothetical protein